MLKDIVSGEESGVVSLTNVAVLDSGIALFYVRVFCC